MYYEPPVEGCDSNKNVVMLPWTNGNTVVYTKFIDHFRANKYCALIFDPRGHGRSEMAPGEYSPEMLSEDAALIIRHVFKGGPVHVMGHSLGGAVALYMGIEHPELVKSLTVMGMASCFGKITPDGECDMSFDPLKWLFSRDFMIKLMGTEFQGRAAIPAIKLHDTDTTMYNFRLQRVGLQIKTSKMWDRWDKVHYHNAIRQIKAPALFLAGGDEDRVGNDLATLTEDTKRIKNAEPPVIFKGFSHGMVWETDVDGRKGLDLLTGAIYKFHAKHA